MRWHLSFGQKPEVTLFTTCNSHWIPFKMPRRSGFGGNVQETSGICFQFGAPRTVPEYSKTLLFSQRQLGASCPRTHLQGHAAPPSPPPALRTGPRSSDRHTISPPTTPASAGFTRPRASPERTPLSELRFPEPHSGDEAQLDTRALPGCVL